MTFTDTPDWADSALTAGANFELYNQTLAVPATSGKSSAAIPVAQFETVAVAVGPSVSAGGSYQVQWYADAAATQLIYSERTYFWGDINTLYNSYAVKAGYLVVFCFNEGGAAQSIAIVVSGVRGGAELGEVFPPQVLSEGNGFNVPANTQTNVAVQSAIPGPASLWGGSGITSIIAVQRYTGTTWTTCMQVNSDQIGGQGTGLVIPGDEIRIAAVNTSGAAGNLNWSLVHGG